VAVLDSDGVTPDGGNLWTSDRGCVLRLDFDSASGGETAGVAGFCDTDGVRQLLSSSSKDGNRSSTDRGAGGRYVAKPVRDAGIRGDRGDDDVTGIGVREIPLRRGGRDPLPFELGLLATSASVGDGSRERGIPPSPSNASFGTPKLWFVTCLDMTAEDEGASGGVVFKIDESTNESPKPPNPSVVLVLTL
jgi:hypothetical protein